MTMAVFAEAPPRLLDLIFQRGEFAKHKPASTAGSRQARPAFPAAASAADRRKQAMALKAFNEEVSALEAMCGVDDPQNNQLNIAAMKLGQFVAAGLLSRTVVEAALEAACVRNSLVAQTSLRAVQATIKSGLEFGLRQARDLSHIDEDATRAGSLPHGRLQPPDPEAAPGDDHASARPATPMKERAAEARDASREHGRRPSGGDGGEDPDPELLRKLALEPTNDTGNARRLIGHFGRDMLCVREVGEHRWAGTHWERVGGDHAFERFAQRTAELIALEALHIQPPKRDLEAIEAARLLKGSPPDRLTAEERALLSVAEGAEERLDKRRGDRRKFSVSCGNRARTEAMIKQARPHITVDPDELDKDPLAINVLNGTLRLVKEVVEEEDPDCPDPDVRRMIKVKRWRVRLDPHDRNDRMSKLMPVAYHRAAECPQWLAFMRRFQPKYEVASFLQRFHGYALTGLTGEQAFLFNYGLGANGKSTFMEALARLQGPYAQVLPPEALTGESQRRSDQATPEFARLPGARLVRCAELPRGESFREATLKMLTGGEPMLVRHLNQGFFEMRPTFKAIGSGNDKPSIKGVDEGIWRRVKLVKWDVTIPVAERRPMNEILAEFEAEASGILNWLLEGLIDYLEDGLRVPRDVAQATESYREDMDPIGEFIGAHVVKVPPEKGKPRETVGARTLYKAYVAWCHLNSIKPFAEFTFSKIMEQKGFYKQKGRLRVYFDIRLEEPPVDPDGPPQGNFAPSGWEDHAAHQP
jgi:putative DNA primase/helicase